MKIKVTQENLNRALSTVSRVAAGRASLPILSNILLKTVKKQLVLASTNLELAITCAVGGKIESQGEITIPARLLTDFISSLPDGNIDLELQNHTLHIHTDQYDSKINGTPADEFPSLPTLKSTDTYKINAAKFKKALNQTVFATSNDEARQVLTGAYLHSHQKNLYIVATDSYRLAEKKVAPIDIKTGVIVPGQSLNELLRIIGDEEDEIELSFDEGQIRFRYGDIDIISRLVDGEYPDYRQLIPKESNNTITLDKEDFINITKVSSLFARESAGSITLRTSEKDQEVNIQSVASQIGENTSKTKAKVTGEGEVTLNSRYLLDGLNVIDDNKVIFSFSGKTNPCLLKGADGKTQDYQHIVMPLRS